MSTSTFQRNLDYVPTASINKVALNNKVVMMRAVVRRAKLHMINKLVKTIQKLKNKKGTEEQQKSNKNKADRLLEEIKIIKMLRHDYVSKFALGSTEMFEVVAKNPKSTIDKRALVRLSQQKFIHDVVTKFRNEHDDWKDLAAYLMTKHTSREYKTKKTKQKMKTVEANVKASETLVQAYLGEKLGDIDALDNDEDHDSDEIDKDKNSDNDDKDKGNLSEGDDGESSETEYVVTHNSDDASGESDESDDNEVDDEVSEEDDKDINVNSEDDDVNFSESDNEEIADKVSSDSGNALVDTSLGAVDTSKAKVLTQQETSVPKSQKLKKENQKKAMKANEGKKKTRPKVVEKVEGEMIVKKINLDSLKEDNEIPAILLGTSTEDKPVKKKKKVRDMFFEMDPEDGDESGIDEEKNDGGQVVDAEEFNQYADDTGVAGQLGVHAFSTTFVGSLRSNEMMGCKDGKYRSNEDWKRIRHEMKDMKMGRGRGSSFQARGGHQGSFGGRGSFRGQPSFRGQGSFRGQNARGRGGFNNFGSQGDSSGQIGRGKPFTKEGMNAKPQKPEILHPSWEASKKRKQQEKGSIQAFSGKKIKFGDD